MARVLTRYSLVRCAALALAAAAAAGCGADDDRPRPTQVAARVNDSEITVHQINAILAQSSPSSTRDAAAARREILERLVDQQLAVQQAKRKNLDRSVYFMQTTEAARMEILARAHAEEFSRLQPKPSAADVKRYYADHPELFSRRRVFVLETINVANTEELAAELKNRVGKAASLRPIADWLRSRNAAFVENRGTHAAEEIPLPMLARMQAMKDGEIAVFEDGSGRLQVVRVAASSTVPVDEAAATPQIQQFLFNRSLNDAMTKERERLRTAAKIEYLGEFAPGAAQARAQARPAPTATDAPGGGNAAPVESAPSTGGAPTPSQLQQQFILKGVRALR